MKVTLKCFTSVDDADPEKVFEGTEYQRFTEGNVHRIVINPNSADPSKSLQVEVKPGQRNMADMLRYERVEVYEQVEGENEPRLSFYADINNTNKAIQPLPAPTFETWTEAGYAPYAYPPKGYDIMPSAGYDAYLADKDTVDAAWNATHPNVLPVDDSLAPLKSDADEAADEANLDALVTAGAKGDELSAAIDAMDYKTLGAELSTRKLAVPQKRADRVLALKDAVVK